VESGADLHNARSGSGVEPSGAQTFPALGAASIDHGTAGASCHAGTEAVTAGTFQAAGLKGTFHFYFLEIAIIR
jgi:hypothetical protein